MPEIVTLGTVCSELKISSREAREKLRAALLDPKKHPELVASHKPKSAWQWVKGSAAEKDARAVLGS